MLTNSALLVAMLHLVMMRYLDGKPTDDKYLAQPYVTSLSLLLVTLFKVCLCGSLAIAFTQHMWKVMGREPLSVSTIESLHGVRYNFFLLGHWRILLATPLLYCMAMVMWLLAITILFPPSALIIVPRHFEAQRSTLVPTFDGTTGRKYDYVGAADQGKTFKVGISSLSSWTMTNRNGPGMDFL